MRLFLTIAAVLTLMALSYVCGYVISYEQCPAPAVVEPITFT